MVEPVRKDVWAAFQHDPRDVAVAPLRAADADRDLIHGVLADAFAEGRLDREEYDERTAATMTARTLGELPPLVADLVPDRPLLPARMPLSAAPASEIERRAHQQWLATRREAVSGFLLPTLICWTIWLSLYFTGNGHFPWPAIVTVATGLNMVRVLASKQEIVASEVERLERKQAKEIEARNRKGPPVP